MALPAIGQFDPAFTQIMDDVMELARQTFLTRNQRCFPVSGLASAGVEAVLNSLIEEGDRVAVGGGPRFASTTTDISERCGARVMPIADVDRDTRLLVAPLVDPDSATALNLRGLPDGPMLVVDATHALGASELRVDDWGIDVCVAGVDHGVGAPSGMALVTYSAEVEARMQARQQPPRISYLDLLQLQAYWSPERLNHHTAPTSLVYGLREALRLVLDEGLEARWQRHRRAGEALRHGLRALGLRVRGELAFAIIDGGREDARRELLERYGVHVAIVDHRTWRVGLLGADATPEAVLHALTAIEKVLTQ